MPGVEAAWAVGLAACQVPLRAEGCRFAPQLALLALFPGLLAALIRREALVLLAE